MEIININMTPNCHEVETIHASQNDTNLRKWGIRPYDYEGNDVTNQQDKATLVDIKGQTLKWNQQSQSSRTTGTVYGLTFSCTDGLWSFQGTYTGENGSPFKCGNSFVAIPAGHKVLLLNTSPWKVRLQGLDISPGSNTPPNRIIETRSGTFADIVVHAYGMTSGDTVNVQCHFGIIDLTVMFGETKANEIYAMETAQIGSGVAYFKSFFPLDYYSYNIGSLIPFMGNGLKTTGKNLVSLALSPARQQRVAGVTIQSQTNEEFTITSTGSGTYSNLGLYYNLKKGTYTLKFQAEASDSYAPIMTVYGYNGGTGQVVSNSIPRNTARTFTLTEDKMVEFRCFATTTSAVRTVRFYDFQLEFGSTATAYEPYTESVINLPISTYFPTGMKSAENAYDELTESKASARVGSCSISDFGSTSSGTSYGGLHYADFTPSSAPKLNSINIVTNKDIAVKGVEAGWASTTPCIIANASFIRIYGTTTDIKTEFSGMEIYFELATPIETDISPELDLTFNIDVGGTEELLPSGLLNGSVDLGSLTWTYMPNNYFRSTSVISDAKIPSNENTVANILCSILKPNTANNVYANNEGIAIDGTGRIRIYYDDMPTDVTSFTQAMQGVYLWYETTDSTPTTTPLNATIKYPAETKDVYFTYQVSDFLSTVFKFYLVTKGIQIPCELEDDTLVADCTSEISNEPGFFDCKIKAENDLGQIFSNKFQLHIERSPE